MNQRKSNLFIISAPSGAGKSTLIQSLLSENPKLLFSISHTTRGPREGEKDGVDYFFVSKEQFQKMIRENELLEWAEVHGAFYGTSKKMLKIAAQRNCDLVLDIDVQGAAQVKKVMPEAITIFILPPSYDALKQRLISRGKDTEQQIAKRIENARVEIRHCKEYDYVIVNHDLESAFQDLICIFSTQQRKQANQQDEIDRILKSFA